MLIAVRARLLAYRCAHFTNGSKSPKVTIIFVPPFRKHICANVTEIARKASTEGGVSLGILVPAILTLNQQGKKKAQKRVCEVCRCGRLARYAFVNSSRVWRGRYDESRIEDTSFTPLLLTNLALQNIILSRQEAAQIQAGNACSERNTEISEEHRTLNTKSTVLSPCELFTCRHYHPQQFCPSPSPYLCSFSNLLFIDIGSGNFQ